MLYLRLMSETIGLLAGLCTTISLIPQVIRTVKTKDTKAISLYMYIIFAVGVILWLVFGITIDSKAVIATNAATLILTGIILFLKIKNLSERKNETASGMN
jgi:MtN3 and saliva related transmembrane protein